MGKTWKALISSTVLRWGNLDGTKNPLTIIVEKDILGMVVYYHKRGSGNLVIKILASKVIEDEPFLVFSSFPTIYKKEEVMEAVSCIRLEIVSRLYLESS